MNPILTTILNNTYSITSLKHKLNVLKNHLQQSFFAAHPTPMEVKDLVWLKSLPPAFFQNFNKDNFYNVFAELEKEIGNIKVLTIYLTFEPDDDTLTAIGAYVRKTFSNVLLLDIKYDPNLIAGAAIVWNGVYRDYSLRMTLNQKKELILESLKKYLR